MRKLMSVLFISGLFVVTNVMADNVGGCGLGSKLFAGKSGLVSQVLAVTVNASSGNQTFGITSGTSGCSASGAVTSNWKSALFIDSNMNKLAKDMSAGEGESLVSLASLMGIEENDRAAFYSATQTNFGTIFGSEEVTAQEVVIALNGVLANNPSLAKYAA